MTPELNDKLLRINLTNKHISKETIPEEVVWKYMGGTGFITYYLYKELEAKIDPLSPQNKIIIAPGPIQGTKIPISGRYAMGAKSPLTGLFLDCNVGGFFGPEIRKAGYDLIIIEGKSEKPVYISIKDDNVEIKDASHLWGKMTHETEDIIRDDEQDKKIKVLAIGPAGENLVKISCTTSDRFRNAGRGGMGAVFGSKNLKAIAVRGTRQPKNGNPEAIEKVREELMSRSKSARDNGHLLHYHGTSWLVDLACSLDQFPTRNFQAGEFEEHKKINHETFDRKYKRYRKPCYNCPVACSELLDASSFEWTDEKRIAKPEYETLGMIGGNCGIGDAEAIIHANYLCNQLGLDTISTGSAIAMTMEAVEKGFINDKKYADIRFGNAEKLLELIEMIAYRRDIGNILAEGIVYASKQWNCEHLAVHSKGLPFAAWDPRGKLGLGLSYATAAVGASHLRGWPSTTEVPDKSALVVLDSLIEQQDLKTIKDSLTICHFTHSIDPPLNIEDTAKIASAVWDRAVSVAEIFEIAKRIWILKRLFNIREYGAQPPKKFDTLPPRFMKEPLPSGRAAGRTAFISEEDFEKSLLTLYKKRGLDENGTPTPETIEKLKVFN